VLYTHRVLCTVVIEACVPKLIVFYCALYGAVRWKLVVRFCLLWSLEYVTVGHYVLLVFLSLFFLGSHVSKTLYCTCVQ